jgi:hypothetical protein
MSASFSFSRLILSAVRPAGAVTMNVGRRSTAALNSVSSSVYIVFVLCMFIAIPLAFI